ncbi:MAG: DUF2892 domain-containing protein [Candidatus Desulforudis sp.]|nr:DUF2892 domain-containing protein [Desulforudis sp.]
MTGNTGVVSTADARLRFKPNVSRPDQAVRLTVGVLLMALAATGLLSPFWAGVLIVLGFFQVATALTRYCPLFDLVGRPQRGDV